MKHVNYQGTIWELDDEVMTVLIEEAFVRKHPGADGMHRVTPRFQETWGHKTHQAFILIVAVLKADRALFDDMSGIEEARSNLVDAVVILKGGRI